MSTNAITPFRWDAFDVYLFDIDGTLLNSRDGVQYNAFHAALQQVWGVNHKIDHVPVHGSTDIAILRATAALGGVVDGKFEQRLPEALAIMCSEAERNRSGMKPELCPSVRDLLSLLYERGRLLGVVSGNLERIGWLKLEAAGIRQYFSFGSFSDRNERREQIFAAGIAEARHRAGQYARICFIGDTPADIAAARTVGMPVIALATGIYSHQRLAQHSPDMCLSCCTDLLRDMSNGGHLQSTSTAG